MMYYFIAGYLSCFVMALAFFQFGAKVEDYFKAMKTKYFPPKTTGQ